MKRLLILIWTGWNKFAHVLGIVNTHILLSVSYFIIIGLVSVLSRIFGADFLDKRMRKKDSYRNKREPLDTSLEACRRQF